MQGIGVAENLQQFGSRGAKHILLSKRAKSTLHNANMPKHNATGFSIKLK